MHKVYFPYRFEEQIQLNEDESKHMSRVLRLGIGDQVLLLNGQGGKALAEIIDAHPKKALLKTISKNRIEKRSLTNLHIAMAPTKNIDRFEWFLEKSTEIGIDEVTPLLCEHSERKVIKEDRLNKVLISAIKQSGQSFLPKLNSLTPFIEFVSNHPNGLIAYCPIDANPVSLVDAVKNRKDITILIGPEGDFSPAEVRFALENGYTQITLGDSILRTETAGVYATAVINS